MALESLGPLSFHPKFRIGLSISMKKAGRIFFLRLLFIYLSGQATCRMLVSGIEPTPSAGEAQGLNHWTTREVLSPIRF